MAARGTSSDPDGAVGASGAELQGKAGGRRALGGGGLVWGVGGPWGWVGGGEEEAEGKIYKKIYRKHL